MKRLFICIGLVILIAGIVSDLRTGSLPKQGHTQTETKTTDSRTTSATPPPTKEPEQTIQSQEVIVEPGHTVLSIVEHLHQEPVPVSIQQIIADFKTLNHSLEPDAIQIGQTYLFPIYEKE